jgi:uncharacterized protein YdhG (YjbR/CyaY superfamily)
MLKPAKLPDTIDAYIARFPRQVQAVLKQVRQAIRKAAPEAEEKISYQMPAFAQHGNLVYFGAWKEHVGLYPASRGVFAAFKKELAPYAPSKGTVKFPLDQAMPLALIGKITKFRLKENLEKEALRKAKRAKARTTGPKKR